MDKRELSVQLLTPLWTGNADMTPNGLKMSGVIGSMRAIFEGIIRELGGHTCNINQDDKRCRYGNKQGESNNICPACAVFGCTGWARTFKLNWELEPFNRVGTILIPESDNCPYYRNRNSKEEVYPGNTSIDTWLATAVNQQRGTIQPGRHNEARSVLGGIRPAYAADRNTRTRCPSVIEIITRRPGKTYDIGTLIAGLLSYMATYYAIGAKVHQGWGFFEVLKGAVNEDVFKGEVRKLIESCRGFSKNDWDQGLLNTKEIHYLAPIEVPYSPKKPVDSLNFQWNAQSKPELYDFIALGFALQYRLRRIIKFWCLDYQKNLDYSDGYFYLLGEDSALDEWIQVNKEAVANYKKDHPLAWRAEGAFAEYLFGKSDSDKEAGKIGVSHLYKKNGKWYVRMISTAPWEYTEHLYDILKAEVTQ